MADNVIFQTDDALSEENLGKSFARSNSTQYVESGLSVTLSSGTIDVTAGLSHLQYQQQGVTVETDARTGLSLPASSGLNHVYLVVDLAANNSVTIEVKSSTQSYSNPELKIAEVDTSTSTVTELARAPTGEYESLRTESVNHTVSSNKYLAHDGTDESAAFVSMLETEEGNGPVHIRLEDDVTLGSKIAPTLSGNRVVIDAIGNPTIDISGVSVSGALDFTAAPNVTLLGPVTLPGATGSGVEMGLLAGDGFRAGDVTLSGGQGGLSIQADDVRVEGLTVTGQHDTNNGEAVGIKVTNASDVVVRDFAVDDCDRGDEIEDDDSSSSPVDGVLLADGEFSNIDNSGASTPSACFSLDVHNHSGGSTISNVAVRDVTVRDSAIGLTVKQDGPSFENVLLSGIDIIDSTDGNNSGLVYGDGVVIRDLKIVQESVSPSYGVEIGGGDVTLDGLRFKGDATSPNNLIRFVGQLGGGNVTLRDINAGGDHWRLINATAATGLESLHIERVVQPGNWLEQGIDGTDGWLASGEGGMTLIDCDLNVDGTGSDESINIPATNAPLTMVGGSANGLINAISGSCFRDVDGVALADVDDGTVVDGAVSESGTGTPAGCYDAGTKVLTDAWYLANGDGTFAGPV